MSPEEEIQALLVEIKRLGRVEGGKTKVAYGVLFKDEHVQQTFEALLGTLKSAKKKKLITFEGELLLQGVHDKVDIIIV